jgi:hypothetical protein
MVASPVVMSSMKSTIGGVVPHEAPPAPLLLEVVAEVLVVLEVEVVVVLDEVLVVLLPAKVPVLLGPPPKPDELDPGAAPPVPPVPPVPGISVPGVMPSTC